MLLVNDLHTVSDLDFVVARGLALVSNDDGRTVATVLVVSADRVLRDVYYRLCQWLSPD